MDAQEKLGSINRKNHVTDEEFKQNTGNPNRYLVSEDLQSVIISSNPERDIKFTFSQRMNTQMVVDNYVLKKKKGPFYNGDVTVINWRCVKDTCQFTVVTHDGQIRDTLRQHNHEPQPELFIHKQARAKIRKSIETDSLSEDTPAADAVNNVVNFADK